MDKTTEIENHRYQYEEYNREERNLCAHLFRLLHEPKDNYSFLRKFTSIDQPVEKFRIYTEVALIRDAYNERKNKGSDAVKLMERIVEHIKRENNKYNATPYTKLVNGLNQPKEPHPRQILLKLNNLKDSSDEVGHEITPDDRFVYREVQRLFSAKPDLAICIDSKLLVYEAKFTMPINTEQLKRTERITKLWTELLFEDLGFSSPPDPLVITISLEHNKKEPDHMSWDTILDLAHQTFGSNADPSVIALENAVRKYGS